MPVYLGVALSSEFDSNFAHQQPLLEDRQQLSMYKQHIPLHGQGLKTLADALPEPPFLERRTGEGIIDPSRPTVILAILSIWIGEICFETCCEPCWKTCLELGEINKPIDHLSFHSPMRQEPTCPWRKSWCAFATKSWTRLLPRYCEWIGWREYLQIHVTTVEIVDVGSFLPAR